MAEYVDFQLVKERVSIHQVLEHYDLWDEFSGDGTQRRGPCPLCESDSRRCFNANVEKNIWRCFGCEAGGNILDLVAGIEECSVVEAARKLAEWFEIPTHKSKSRRKSRQAPTKKPKPEEEKAEPEGCDEGSDAADEPHINEPLSFDRLKHLEFDHEALTARGMMSDTAEHFGIGFCTRGIMKGTIAIPLHDAEGRLLAYAGASPDGPTAPYRWPKGFRPELEVYNIHRAAQSETLLDDGLFVAPDPLDVVRLHETGRDNAVALMGTTPTRHQLVKVKTLLQACRNPLVMWLEPTASGPPSEAAGSLSLIAWVRTLRLSSLRAQAETNETRSVR